MIRNILRVPSVSVSRSRSEIHGRTRVAGMLSGKMELSSRRNSPDGFRTLCTDSDLSIKKCVPCNLKTLQPMTAEDANIVRLKVPEWDLLDEGSVLKLSRSLKVRSFIKGMELLKMVAELAEAEGHHPDLHLVGWNNAKIEIWTHAVGGLTENDFILAAKISQLKLHHLLKHCATG